MQKLCHPGHHIYLDAWSALLVSWTTESMEKCCSSAVSLAVHCFSFFSTVRANALNRPGPFWFLNLATCSLTGRKREISNNLLCPGLEVFFFHSECLNFRPKGGDRPRHTLQVGLGFQILWLGLPKTYLLPGESGKEAVPLCPKGCGSRLFFFDVFSKY